MQNQLGRWDIDLAAIFPFKNRRTYKDHNMDMFLEYPWAHYSDIRFDE